MSSSPPAAFAARPAAGPIRTGRGLFRILAILTVVATLFGGFTALPQTALAAPAQTTANLNLRSGPGTDYGVIVVIPSGSTVNVDGDPRNGFYPLTFNGRSGYASGDYLSIGGGGSSDGGSSDGGASDGGSPSATGTATVTARLNLRAGPSSGDGVLTVMPTGATVTLTGRSSNGYVAVDYRGTSGWAFAQYLGSGGGSDSGDSDNGDDGGSSNDGGNPSATGSATTTTRLNLRSGPSTGDGVITVMPDGATVTLNGRESNGYLSVSYNGTQGWAASQYLSRGGGGSDSGSDSDEDDDGSSSGTVPVGNTVTGSRTVTTGLNLRTGPGTDYGVIRVMPTGATVEVMGDASAGYLPVRYQGTKGWASGDYLSTGGGSTAGGNNGGESGNGSDDIVGIIYAAADRYGQPREDMLRVARCESNLNPRARNAASSASGLFQFIPSTWASTPYANYDIFDPWASANAAGWMWANGRRNEWSCQ